MTDPGATGERLKEATKINLSLSALGTGLLTRQWFCMVEKEVRASTVLYILFWQLGTMLVVLATLALSPKSFVAACSD